MAFDPQPQRLFSSPQQMMLRLVTVFAFVFSGIASAGASVIFVIDRNTSTEFVDSNACEPKVSGGLLSWGKNEFVSSDSGINSSRIPNLPDYPSEQFDWISAYNELLLPLGNFSLVPLGGGMGSTSNSSSGSFASVVFADLRQLSAQPPLILAGRVYFFVNLDVPPAPASEVLRPPNGFGRVLLNI